MSKQQPTTRQMRTNVAVVQSELDRDWMILEDECEEAICRILDKELVRKKDLPVIAIALEAVAKQIFVNRTQRRISFAKEGEQ